MVDIQAVQLWRKFFVVLGSLALLMLTFRIQALPSWEHPVEHLGLIAIMVCVIGRAWCSLYVGGRKKREVVQIGPYSICRNPLYVFSFFGAFGVGAQTGSLSVGAIFAVSGWLIFRVVVAYEERFLTETFGEKYAEYRERTPRFLPKPALWRDASELTIRPALFRRTVMDGALFLLALPLFESIERLQRWAWADAVLRLP